MVRRYRTLVVLLVAALSLAAAPRPPGWASAGVLTGTITVKMHETYSAPGVVSSTTCSATLTLTGDGTTSAEVRYTHDEQRTEIQEGNAATVTTVHEEPSQGGSFSNVSPRPSIYVDAARGIYFLSFSVPPVRLKGTETTRTTGEQPMTKPTPWRYGVCPEGDGGGGVIGHSNPEADVRGALPGGTRLHGTVQAHGDFDVSGGNGTTTISWSLTDPTLGVAAPAASPTAAPGKHPGPGKTCSVQAAASAPGSTSGVRELKTQALPAVRGMRAAGIADRRPGQPETCLGRWFGTIRDLGNTSISIKATSATLGPATWHFEQNCDETLRFSRDGFVTATGTIGGRVTITDDRTGSVRSVIDILPGGSSGDGRNGGNSMLTVSRNGDGSLVANWNPVDLLATASSAETLTAATVHCIPLQEVNGRYGLPLSSPAAPGDVIGPQRVSIRRTLTPNLSAKELQWFANLSVHLFGPPGYTFITTEGSMSRTAPTLPRQPGVQANRHTIILDLYR